MPSSDLSSRVHEALRKDSLLSAECVSRYSSGRLRSWFRVVKDELLVASVGVLAYDGCQQVLVRPEAPHESLGASHNDLVDRLYRTLECELPEGSGLRYHHA